MSTQRRVLVISVVAALVVGPALVWGVFLRDSGDDTPESQATATAVGDAVDLGFPKPEQRDIDADRAYLAAEGQVLLLLHQQAAALDGIVGDGGPTPELCQEMAATLDRDAPADEVLARIGGVSDPVLREAFHTERTALGVSLTQCISGEQAEGPVPGLHEAVEAVNVRLAEMGLD